MTVEEQTDKMTAMATVMGEGKMQKTEHARCRKGKKKDC